MTKMQCCIYTGREIDAAQLSVQPQRPSRRQIAPTIATTIAEYHCNYRTEYNDEELIDLIACAALIILRHRKRSFLIVWSKQ